MKKQNKKGYQFAIKPELHKELEKESQRSGFSMSLIIELAVKDYLNEGKYRIFAKKF